MNITPDNIIYWQMGPAKLNATIVFTWAVMLLMVIGSWLITRRLSSGAELSRGQNLLEVVVSNIRSEIREISRHDPRPYIPFIGTLFLFIALSNALTIVPRFEPPTGSLSTTGALALCVFIAVPFYGIAEQGLIPYFRHYISPTPLMLPFHLISEISRTLALAIRLFGNIMSGSMIVAILLALTPLFFPIVMHALGLLVGLVQAYIFAVLAMVYIASSTRRRQQRTGEDSGEGE